LGDLAFGAPLGIVNKGKDETEIPGGPVSYTPAVEVLNRRGEVSSTLGLLPALRPWAKYHPDPFFRQGIAAVQNLNGIAVAAVTSQLDAAEKGDSNNFERNDLLTRLLQGKDANGQKMGRQEVTAEALTQLIAGSDTISNTAYAVFYWILHGERAAPGTIIPQLQQELDSEILAGTDVATYASVKHRRRDASSLYIRHRTSPNRHLACVNFLRRCALPLRYSTIRSLIHNPSPCRDLG
jgi:benzoate 4-monooxygenase